MAEEKEPLADSTITTAPAAPATQEAPPAYESLNLTHPNNLGQDTWRRTGALTQQQPISLPTGPTNAPSPAPAFRPPASTQTGSPRGHTRSLSSSSTTSLKAKKSWFNFKSSSTGSTAPSTASSRTITEVRATVCGLVRNLVVGGPQEQLSAGPSSLSPAAAGILQSCAEACATHSMSLSAILQDKFVESHSPLYWAIVKSPTKAKAPTQKATLETQSEIPSLLDSEEVEEPGPESAESDSDLLGALLSHAKPLDAATVSELRLACLATSDQATFQRLRLALPGFSSTPGADQILLGQAHPADHVAVEIGDGADGAFSATMQIPQFHKRMMVSREIGLEFIARNRLWRFSFLITPDAAWYGPPPGSWCATISLQEPSPPTWLDAQLAVVSAPGVRVPALLRLKSKQMMEAPRNGVPASQVVVALEESPAFASLQYSGSSYIPDDEKLTVRLEAKLRKPTQDHY